MSIYRQIYGHITILHPRADPPDIGMSAAVRGRRSGAGARPGAAGPRRRQPSGIALGRRRCLGAAGASSPRPVVRGVVRAGPPDRSESAGRLVRVRRRGMDGSCRGARAGGEGNARAARHQSAGADRPGRQQGCAAHRAGVPDRAGARQRAAGDGRSGGGAGRKIRAGSADPAGRLEHGGGPRRPGAERARGAGAGGARRGPAGDRLCHRRSGRAGRARGRHVPGIQPHADHRVVAAPQHDDCYRSKR